MFTTFQGGPFVEVFSPPGRTHPPPPLDLPLHAACGVMREQAVCLLRTRSRRA